MPRRYEAGPSTPLSDPPSPASRPPKTPANGGLTKARRSLEATDASKSARSRKRDAEIESQRALRLAELAPSLRYRFNEIDAASRFVDEAVTSHIRATEAPYDPGSLLRLQRAGAARAGKAAARGVPRAFGDRPGAKREGLRRRT